MKKVRLIGKDLFRTIFSLKLILQTINHYQVTSLPNVEPLLRSLRRYIPKRTEGKMPEMSERIHSSLELERKGVGLEIQCVEDP